MNVGNINKAIAVMERVRDREYKFDITLFQEVDGGEGLKETEEELHACGGAACFSGWLAVSEEWRADGGFSSPLGAALMGEEDDLNSISRWFGVKKGAVEGIIYPSTLVFGKKRLQDISAQDVIDALVRLRDRGLAWRIQ